MPDTGRTRLVVVFGGRSAERDVSGMSAARVVAAIDPDQFDVVPVGIDRLGRWLLAEDTKALIDSGRASEIGGTLPVVGTQLDPWSALEPARRGQQVVVFPMIHGPLGEDGTIQGLLELAGVPYAGSGLLGSALCRDKAGAKAIAAAAGLPQGAYLAARDTEERGALVSRAMSQLGLPVFVKPANMGSSVGVTRCTDRGALLAGVDFAFGFGEWVVIETAITGREIELGVLGNGQPRVSVPGEIIASRDFYDYDDKYGDDGAELVVPADLPDEIIDEAQTLALGAFRALRCDGYARVDLFYEAAGRGLLLNEVNALPGFTPSSMFPSLWAASGFDQRDLITEIVRLGLERHEHRALFGRGAQPQVP